MPAATPVLSRRERWEHAAEWPMTLMALVFLVAYAVPILRPGTESTPYDVVAALSWIAFGVDYAVRFWLSEHRVRFVTRHPLDALVILLPVLRPLRLIQVLALLSTLNRYAGGGPLRGRIAVYLVSSSTLLVLVASLAVLDAERGQPGSNLDDYGDATWWAMTTMTTVGYGDHFPVTGTGRLIAVGLMVAGIALLGTVTATLASFLVERVEDIDDALDEQEGTQAATHADVQALLLEVRELRAEVARLERTG